MYVLYNSYKTDRKLFFYFSSFRFYFEILKASNFS